LIYTFQSATTSHWFQTLPSTPVQHNTFQASQTTASPPISLIISSDCNRQPINDSVSLGKNAIFRRNDMGPFYSRSIIIRSSISDRHVPVSITILRVTQEQLQGNVKQWFRFIITQKFSSYFTD